MQSTLLALAFLFPSLAIGALLVNIKRLPIRSDYYLMIIYQIAGAFSLLLAIRFRDEGGRLHYGLIACFLLYQMFLIRGARCFLRLGTGKQLAEARKEGRRTYFHLCTLGSIVLFPVLAWPAMLVAAGVEWFRFRN